MICIIHGGQTGVDRGAHEAAIANGWSISGYMPRRRCDELGPIPADVAQRLTAYESGGYADRTKANVRISDALLVVVPSVQAPERTPGTAMTIDLARERSLSLKIVDPYTNSTEIGDWIASLLRELATTTHSQRLLFAALETYPVCLRLMIAGPRESRWNGARAATVQFLREVGLQIQDLDAASRRIA